MLVASWLVVPLVLALAISYFKPMLVDRYLIVGVPALAWRQPTPRRASGRWAGSAALILLILVAMTHVRDWYGSLIEQDWRTAVRYVEQKKTPAEQLLANPSLLLAPVDYYAERAR